MIDVDFRYVVREEAAWDLETGKGSMSKVKVLQWRKRLKEYLLNDGWTEWEDVRTEEE